ncbi:uncharacterized protein LOC144175497 isoform X2 [Haemaphysalis longicornis]
MAESGAGDAGYGRSAKARPVSPMEELEDDPPFEIGYGSPTENRLRERGPPFERKVRPPHVKWQVPVASTVMYRSAMERDDTSMDEELKALGLWEEDMTEEQKKELLRVVADSKVTAQHEEAVRKSHFPRPSSLSEAAARDSCWEKREPPVGLVKPCMAAPESALCSDRLDHMSRKFITKVSEDDDWPVSGSSVNPSRRSVLVSKPIKRTPVTQRVCSMDQPLQFLWDYGDGSEDLYDARLHQESAGAIWKGPEDTGPWGPSAALRSWETMHAALKAAQSARDLPVRPWGHTRDASPVGAQDGSNLKEPDLPSKESPNEGSDARPISAMEDDEASGGQA